MENFTPPKTEKEHIEESLYTMANHCSNGNADNYMAAIENATNELYANLFAYRDAHQPSPRSHPVLFPLHEVLADLKFGRPAYDQKALDGFIATLPIIDEPNN